jgi:putative ABC transport system permease protein
MDSLKQVWIVTRLAFSTLPQRLGPALVTLVGMATVVAVMTAILAMGAGVRRFIDITDQPERAVVLSAASPSEYAGSFTPAQVAMIAAAPGVRRLPDGQPMVQPLAAAPVQMIRRADGAPGYVFLRGTGMVGNAMNNGRIRVVEGRIWRSGLRELVVGEAIREQYVGTDVGDTVMLHGEPWIIVGRYVDDGAIDEESLAGDVDMVRAALGAPTYQSVGVMLASPGDFGRFRDALLSNPQLNVRVLRLSQYYHGQMGPLLSLFDIVGWFVGGVMAVGAIATALTTLFAAAEARSREIATLRAIGFSGAAAAASVLAESLALAIPAALVGLAVATLAFNDKGVATAGVLFKATVTPQLCLLGAGVAIAIGLVGGLFPALRAASRPVTDALRAT